MINEKELIKRMALGVIFADPLAQMYLATMAREKSPGTLNLDEIGFLEFANTRETIS